MIAFIEFYFLARQIREMKQPGPCRKCHGPIIAPGAACPACGFRLGTYAVAQWSRLLRGAAVGVLLVGLGTWFFTGHVDWHATAIITVVCGGISCCFK